MKALYLALISTLLFTACSFERKEEPKPAPEPPIVEKVTNDLFESIDKQDVAAVERFIKEGADLKRFDDEGKTPLMRSVQVGNARIIEILIVAGSYIYQPEESDPDQTAFLMAQNTGGLVINLFEKEKLRLLTSLESKMKKGEYKASLNFIEKNYLPLDITLPVASVGPLEYLIKNDKSPSEDSKVLATYYLENNHDSIVSEFSNVKKIIEYGSRSQDKEFLKAVIKRYAGLDQNEVGYNKFRYVGLYFPGIDITLGWLIEKTKVYVESGVAPEPTSFANSIFPTVKTYQSLSRSEINQFVSLMDIYFEGTKEIKGKSRQLPDEYLEDYLFAGFHEVENGFYLVSELLNLFAKHKVYEYFLFHKDLLSRAFKADMQFNIPLSELLRFIDLRAAISGSSGKISKDGDFDLEESIKVDGSVHKKGPLEFLIEDYLRNEKRKSLIVHLLKNLRELPENIVSLVLKEDRELFETLLSAGLVVEPKDNRGALIAAVQHATDGQEARLYLRRLKEVGFSVKNRSLSEVLENAFQRLWEGDDSFSSTVQYIFTEFPEYKNLSISRKMNIIKNHCAHIRKSKKHWELIADILPLFENINEQIDSMSWLEKEEQMNLKRLEYQSELDFDGNKETYNITVPMDILIGLYEVYSNGAGQVAPMRNIIVKVFNTLSKGSMSMSTDELNGFREITHQILPLAQLFSMTTDEIVAARDADGSNNKWLWWTLEYTGYQEGSLGPVQWNSFLVDDMFLYYSRHRDYWKMVVEEFKGN